MQSRSPIRFSPRCLRAAWVLAWLALLLNAVAPVIAYAKAGGHATSATMADVARPTAAIADDHSPGHADAHPGSQAHEHASASPDAHHDDAYHDGADQTHTSHHASHGSS